MPNSKDRSRRLLELYILLTQESSEAHPFTTADMISRMNRLGLGCSRKAIYQELNALWDYNVPMRKKRVGKSMGYYCTVGSFKPGELQILFDAVQACSFISSEDSDKLINKIATQSGCFDASELAHSLIRFNTRKQDNPQIFDTIETCVRAVREQKQLSFRYFHYGFTGDKEYDYEGQKITAEPYFLVFYEDWFYLIARSPMRQEIRHYRLDRIAEPEILNIPLSEEALSARPDPEEYTKLFFRMFGGEETEVTLEFDKQALSAVYDKYGTAQPIVQLDDNTGMLTRNVVVSPVFFSWVSQFAGAMRITAPEDIRSQYKAHLLRCINGCK